MADIVLDFKKSRITFEVTHVVPEGHVLLMVGSVPELSNWQYTRGIILKRISEFKYETTITINYPVVLEFKFLHIGREDNKPYWMDGENQVYEVDLNQSETRVCIDWKELDGSGLIRNDSYLMPFIQQLKDRSSYFKLKKNWLVTSTTPDELNKNYNYLGFNRSKANNSIIYREWAPNASRLALIGPFNNWNENVHVAKKNDKGVWELEMLDTFDGSPLLKVGEEYKAVVYTPSGERLIRVPAYATRAEQRNSNVFSGVYWPLDTSSYPWKHERMGKYVSPTSPLIYELHVGMSGKDEKVSSYREFTDEILPRIKELGYNTLQVMAIMEHAYYGSFGYHVTSFYAASSRFGSPQDLMYMIDTAHSLGIRVVMDLVHSHACKNEEDGMGRWDGSNTHYFHPPPRGDHPVWDSKCFDYGKKEVLCFLLSNLRFWIEEYRFDGYRFDGITSMLYDHHGLGDFFTGYHSYFSHHTDKDAVFYLQMANELLTELNAISIAEDVSGMPALCQPVIDGGIGFDYRLHMGIPSFWIKQLEKPKNDYDDNHWSMGEIVHTMTYRRHDEMCVSYVECHDQSLVGDKTTLMHLLDGEIYTGMSTLSSSSKIIERGIALHKLMRLVTFGLGGDAYLTFIGNEFGHPEWVDFPTIHNNSSYKYARRQWNLVDDSLLRYHHLNNFDKAMIKLENTFLFLSDKHYKIIKIDEGGKIIIFSRGSLLWIFNFHPYESSGELKLQADNLEVVLSSDDVSFGGRANVYSPKLDKEGEGCYVSLPPRTAIVLCERQEDSRKK